MYFDSDFTEDFNPKGSIGNETALVPVMAWRRTGDKQYTESALAQFTDA